MNFKKSLRDGLLTNNPVLGQLLGMCSTMAITTTLFNGIGMGVSVTLILICSNIVISALRKLIPDKIRIAAYIVIIAGFVTMVDLLLKAYLPALSESLGVFIPLIVVNCIILARAEAYASKNPVLPSAVDGLSMGLGFTAALVLIASVREILGAGAWLGLRVTPDAYDPALIFILPAGAFLSLGVIAAAVNKGRTLAAAYADAHPKPEGVAVLPDEIVTEAPAAESAPDDSTIAEAPSDDTAEQTLATESADTPEQPQADIPAEQEPVEESKTEESEVSEHGTAD